MALKRLTEVTKKANEPRDSRFCEHRRLNEDGICRECGADCRGIGGTKLRGH